MPTKYSDKQKEERIAYINARILIAKTEWNKEEVKRLYNLRGSAKAKFGMMSK